MSDDDQRLHKVAQEVDAPVPILFWDPIEFIIAIAVMGFGMLLNMWMLGALGAMAVLYFSNKLKRGAKRGAVQHWLWSVGMQIDPFLKNKFPAPWKKEFIE